MCNLKGNYIGIALSGSNRILTLCEVEALGNYATPIGDETNVLLDSTTS